MFIVNGFFFISVICLTFSYLQQEQNNNKIFQNKFRLEVVKTRGMQLGSVKAYSLKRSLDILILPFIHLYISET